MLHRARREIRARRCRRPFRRQRRAGLSRHESQRPRADGRGQRHHHVGIELDHALSLRHAPRRDSFIPPTRRGAASSSAGWIGSCGHGGPATTPLFFGYVRTPPEKRDAAALERARKEAIPIWQHRRGLARASGLALSRRQRIHDRRHPGRRSSRGAGSACRSSGRRCSGSRRGTTGSRRGPASSSISPCR